MGRKIRLFFKCSLCLLENKIERQKSPGMKVSLCLMSNSEMSNSEMSNSEIPIVKCPIIKKQ